jgi:P-type Cu+ transporter
MQENYGDSNTANRESTLKSTLGSVTEPVYSLSDEQLSNQTETTASYLDVGEDNVEESAKEALIILSYLLFAQILVFLLNVRQSVWIQGFDLTTPLFSKIIGIAESLFTLVLGIAVSCRLCISLYKSANKSRNVKNGYNFFSIPNSFIIAITFSVFSTLLIFIFAPEEFVGSKSYNSLIVVVATFALLHYSLFKIFCLVQNKIGFTIADKIDGVRVLALSGEKNQKVRRINNKDLSGDNLLQTEKLLSSGGYTIPLHEVQSGDVIKVLEKEIIPLDGVILSGAAEVSERVFSGYSTHLMKDRGQEVTAGSIVVKGSLECRVKRPIWKAKIATFAERFEDTVRQAVRPLNTEPILVCRSLQLIWLASFLGALACFLNYQGWASALRTVSAVLLILFLPMVVLLARCLRGIAVTALFKSGILIKNSSILSKINSVDTLVINQPLPVRDNEWEFLSLDILDERYDPDSLRSVLISLLRYSNSEMHSLIYQTLRPQTEKLIVYTIEDLEYQENHSCIGRLEGSYLVFGDEEFLINNNVYLQASDIKVVDSGESNFFFAVDSEVVARLKVAVRPHYRGLAAISELRKKFGVRSLLWSLGNANQLDEVGKSAGLDAAQVQGGLNTEEFNAKLLSLSNVALYSDYRGEGISNALISIGRYSNKIGELPPTDVVLFNRDPKVLTSLFAITRKFLFYERAFLILATVASALLFTLLLFQVIDVGLCCLVLVAIIAIAETLIYALANKNSLW